MRSGKALAEVQTIRRRTQAGPAVVFARKQRQKDGEKSRQTMRPAAATPVNLSDGVKVGLK
jgi:hypothetical protein